MRWHGQPMTGLGASLCRVWRVCVWPELSSILPRVWSQCVAGAMDQRAASTGLELALAPWAALTALPTAESPRPDRFGQAASALVLCASMCAGPILLSNLAPCNPLPCPLTGPTAPLSPGGCLSPCFQHTQLTLLWDGTALLPCSPPREIGTCMEESVAALRQQAEGAAQWHCYAGEGSWVQVLPDPPRSVQSCVKHHFPWISVFLFVKWESEFLWRWNKIDCWNL